MNTFEDDLNTKICTMAGSYKFDEGNDFIGEGAYSKVFKAYKIGSKVKVAIKRIENDSKCGGHFADSAKKEYDVLQKVKKHRNVIELLDFYTNEIYICLVMEFCDYGDLEKYLPIRNPDMKLKLKLMLECASAISFMHGLEPRKVIHRDIKLGNILVKNTLDGDTIKLSDFGLSKILEPSQIYLETDVGTLAFRAPELFLTEGPLKYTHTVDNFSMGLVYMVILNFQPSTPEDDSWKLPTPESIVGKAFLPYGQHLLQPTVPPLFHFTPADHGLLVDLKHLITKMTLLRSNERESMKNVEVKLLELIKEYNKSFPHSQTSTSDVRFNSSGQSHLQLPVQPATGTSQGQKGNKRNGMTLDDTAINIGLPHDPDTVRREFEQLCEGSWFKVLDNDDMEAQSHILSSTLLVLYREARGTYGALIKKIYDRKVKDSGTVKTLYKLLRERNHSGKFQTKDSSYSHFKDVIASIKEPFKDGCQDMYINVDQDLEHELQRYLLTVGEHTPLHDYGHPILMIEKIKTETEQYSLNTCVMDEVLKELSKLQGNEEWPIFCKKAALLMWYTVLQRPLMYIELTHIKGQWSHQCDSFVKLELESHKHKDSNIVYYTRPVLYRGGILDYNEDNLYHLGGEVWLKGRALIM